MQGQLDLFALNIPAPPAPAPARVRTWADVRVGEQTTYNVPGSPWRGVWTVRRIELHPNVPYELIATLVEADGRVWVKCPHRDAPADVDATP